ncbi:MAG: hypothetical protein ACRD12_21465, partial [Acidimicrobiales bacterium]
FEVVGPLIITTFSWPSESGVPFSPVNSGDTAADFEFASWITGYAYPLITLVGFAIARADPEERKSLNLVTKIILSLAGAVNILFALTAAGFAIGEGDLGASEDLELVSGFLNPWSNAFSFLTSSLIEEDSEDLALALKLIIDAVGDLGGGLFGAAGFLVEDL